MMIILTQGPNELELPQDIASLKYGYFTESSPVIMMLMRAYRQKRQCEELEHEAVVNGF